MPDGKIVPCHLTSADHEYPNGRRVGFDAAFRALPRPAAGPGCAISPYQETDLIFSGDGAKTSVFPRAFSSGSLSPLRSFNAPAGLPVVDSEGGEVYLYQSNRISVYPSSSTGTPSPTRTIQGSATQLYQTLQLTICN